MKTTIALGTLLSVSLGLYTQVGAAVSGQIQARLVITAGCEVNSGDSTLPSGSVGALGTLDFGAQAPTWASPIGASLDTAAGAVQVACNPSVTGFTVTIDGGAHGDGSTRRLSNGRQTIPYLLYLNPAGTERYSIGQQKTFSVSSGGQVPIPIFGAVVANTSALPAGVYSDTLTVTLDW